MTTLGTPRHKRVAAEVRAEMARRDFQQKDLAIALGVSNAAASELCRGNVPFTLDRLDTVADWLGVPLVVLLGAGPVGAPGGPVSSGWNYRNGRMRRNSPRRLALCSAA